MKSKELTLLAMFIAITVLLGIIPNIGIIQIGVVSLTILHIPVIIASCMLGIKGGLITGLCFGLTSFYVASTRAISPIDLLFVNPLISILPRVLFGVICGLLCNTINKDKSLSLGICGFVCTILHTFLVYIALYIWGRDALNINALGAYSFVKYIFAAISINSILEAVVAGIIVSVIYKSIKHIRVHN